MRRYVMYVFVFALAVTMAGCAASGRFASANLTNVELSEKNFRIVATNLSGEASAEYLLGFSSGSGWDMYTLAAIRVKGDGLLYKAALEDLWRNFERDHGSPEGRQLALVNVRYDTDAMNVLGLYTKPKISIRADVVEFTE